MSTTEDSTGWYQTALFYSLLSTYERNNSIPYSGHWLFKECAERRRAVLPYLENKANHYRSELARVEQEPYENDFGEWCRAWETSTYQSAVDYYEKFIAKINEYTPDSGKN